MVENGLFIQQARKKSGFSQAELADLIGVHETTIRRWESNRSHGPNASDIAKLAAALHVTEAELLNGPREEKIRIELVFGALNEDEEAIDMSDGGNKFKLFLNDDGGLGIKGAAKFESKEALKDFAAEVLRQLEFGFDCQVQRGALPAGA